MIDTLPHHAQVLADTAHRVVESHRTGRERFPRHLTGIPHRIDESWDWTLPEKYAETDRRDLWLH